MKKTIIITSILGMLVAAAWWWERSPAQNLHRANVTEFESDMTEALLNGIFRELDSGNPPVYFVAFGEARTAASRGFVARFAGHVPPVRVFDSAVITPTGLTIETDSGRAGILLQIISLKETKPGSFDALVAFSNLPPGHNRFTYHILNVGGDWTINSRKPA